MMIRRFPGPTSTCGARSRRWRASDPALAAEDRYRAWLRDNRAAATRRRDAALIGPHVADLETFHGPKGAPAGAVLDGRTEGAAESGLVLAHARLVADMSGLAPLALLDEVAAHLIRAAAPCSSALERIGGQVFVTGADPGAFAGLRAKVHEVTPGRVSAPSGVAGL